MVINYKARRKCSYVAGYKYRNTLIPNTGDDVRCRGEALNGYAWRWSRVPNRSHYGRHLSAESNHW